MNHIEGILRNLIVHGVQNIFKLKNQLFPVVSTYNTSSEYIAFRQSIELFDYLEPVNMNAEQSKVLTNLNYSVNKLQFLVPIPPSTSISSQHLHTLSITQKIKQTLSIPIRDISSMNYSKYYPQKTRILWLVGNENIDNSTTARTIIYIHGGYYVLGGTSHIGFASRLSIASNTRVVYICYDVPPKLIIPNQVDQVLTVYFYLTKIMQIPPQQIIIAGDSAGGGLSLLTMQKLGINGLFNLYPAGIIGISVGVHLQGRSQSYITNQDTDFILSMDKLKYLGPLNVGHNPNNFENGYYSALYGPSFSQLPRMYFIVSKHEKLYDDTMHLAEKFRHDTQNKVDLKVDIVEGMPHDWMLFLDLFPEANQSFDMLIQILSDWKFV